MKRFFMGAVAALALSTCILVPVSGCGPLLDIATKTVAIADGVLPWVDLVAAFLDTAMTRAGADLKTRTDVAAAIDATRKSGFALRDIAQLGEAVSQADLDRATTEFRESWLALIAAGKAFGLEVDPLAMLPPQDGRMRATQGDRLSVPPPDRLLLEAD